MADLTKDILIDDAENANSGNPSGLKVTFNKSAGTATLEGAWGVSSSGYSYTVTPSETPGKDNEVHLDLNIIPPDGMALTVMSELEIRDAFSISAKTSDIYVHVKSEYGSSLKLRARLEP